MNSRRCPALSLLFLLACSSLFGEPVTPEDERGKQLKQVFYDAAAGYEITTDDAGAVRRLPLRNEPIMHWLSNDSAKGTHVGSVFVWTHEQRPEVVGTIFTWDGAKSKMPGCEEFYSFSSGQLLVRSGSGKVWKPAPCRELSRIPDAPVPAATAEGRRLQIRKMSRDFSGRMNRLGEPHPLRLLPRPVYEYDSGAPDILGGALLTLVAYSTDPDILLLIEARETREGPRWFFQPARFSDKSLWLMYQGREIWSSLRQRHGTEAPQPDDPQYHVEYVKLDAPLDRDSSQVETAP